MPILRLNFINELIIIYLTIEIYGIIGKTHNPTNQTIDNNIYILLHIILVTSLSR